MAEGGGEGGKDIEMNDFVTHDEYADDDYKYANQTRDSRFIDKIMDKNDATQPNTSQTKSQNSNIAHKQLHERFAKLGGVPDPGLFSDSIRIDKNIQYPAK